MLTADPDTVFTVQKDLFLMSLLPFSHDVRFYLNIVVTLVFVCCSTPSSLTEHLVKDWSAGDGSQYPD